MPFPVFTALFIWVLLLAIMGALAVGIPYNVKIARALLSTSPKLLFLLYSFAAFVKASPVVLSCKKYLIKSVAIFSLNPTDLVPPTP